MIKKFFIFFMLILHIFYGWLTKIKFAQDKTKGRMNYKNFMASTIYRDIINNYINKLEIEGSIEKNDENKVDVFISNHTSSIDFIIISYILHKFQIRNYYCIYKKELNNIPLQTDCFKDDIKIDRNWDKDKDAIIEQLDRIKSGLIIIFPEGTRFDKKKYVKSKKFCYENKLPIFNYTLAPKAKGTHLILENLYNKNKLGNIYDTTILFNNHIKSDLYLMKLIQKNIGNLNIKIESIKFNTDDLKYENFKEKLFRIWLKKNIYIDRKQLSLAT